MSSELTESRNLSGNGDNLHELVAIMQRLLGEGGCPWDREQTLETLRPFVIEEAFEVVDAIDQGSPNGAALREELGDLLLQIVFQAELARQSGWFGPNDVVTAICEKLVRRHPHVFGSERADTSAEVLSQWEKLKAKEKAGRGALDGVPRALPGLLRGVRMGEKAGRFGYDFADARAVRTKLGEELGELDTAIASSDRARIEEELGDVLFALSSLARKLDVDPEAALRGTLSRFSQRFTFAEREAAKTGRALDELTDLERDALWEQAKAKTST